MAKKLLPTKVEEKEEKKIETVENDVKKIEEIKEELVAYTKEKIDTEVQNSFKKVEKKINKSKNGKIFRRDILIILLLCLSGFLGYKLYKTGYFNEYFYLEKDKDSEKVEEKEPVKENENNETPNEEVKEPEKDLSFHKVALDNFYLSNNSDYLNDFYDGNLSNELLLSMAVNKLDDGAIEEDEDSYILNSEDLKKCFEELFENIEYEPKSFKYNGISFKYLKSQEIFVISEAVEIKNETNIVRYISDIKENDNKVIIKTIEGIKNNNNLINILNKNVVGKYKNEESLKDNADKLNQIEYTFKFEDDSYKLIGIKSIK